MGDNILKLIKPADVITIANALLGFASIMMVIQGNVESALVLVLIAVIADGADGAVARYSGYGILGANLDSLADVISFGLAPAVLAFYFLNKNIGSFAWIFSGLFLVCGTLRLARFNAAGKKDGFEGIPITSGGFAVALFLQIRDSVPYFESIFALILVVLSLLMVSTIAYPKLKNPAVLAPMTLLLFFDVVVFFLGYTEVVKIAALILLILIFGYILSPLGRRFYGNK